MKKSKIFLMMIVTVMMMIVFTGCSNGNAFEGNDFSDSMKLGEYKGLKYQPINTKVSDEEVQKYIDSDLAKHATKSKIEDSTVAVADGDSVNIKFVGRIDGKEFDGGSSESFDMVIGQTPMIDGFSKGIVGHKVGETFKENLQFPEDYHAKNLAGKPVEFEITVNYIEKSEKPELNDEWVAKNTEYKTVEEYKAGIREKLDIQLQKSLSSSVKDGLLAQVMQSTKFKKVPDKLVDIEYKRNMDILDKLVLSKQKISFKEYAKTLPGMDKNVKNPEKELKKKLKEQSEEITKRKMVIYAIAKKEKIEVTDEEAEKVFKNTLKNINMDDKKFEKEYKMKKSEAIELFDYKYAALYDKVLDKLMKLGKPQK